MRIVETRNAMFIENGEISESTISRDVKIKKVRGASKEASRVGYFHWKVQ